MHGVTMKSAVTNLHNSLLLSCSFLLVAGWWLPYSYLSFLPLWESQDVQMFRNVVFLQPGKTQGHLMSQNKFCGTLAQSSLNPIKPGQMGSLWIFWAVALCSVASKNILRSKLAPPWQTTHCHNIHNNMNYPVSTSQIFLISNFCCCLNAVFLLLGDSPASEFTRQGITQK